MYPDKRVKSLHAEVSAILLRRTDRNPGGLTAFFGDNHKTTSGHQGSAEDAGQGWKQHVWASAESIANRHSPRNQQLPQQARLILNLLLAALQEKTAGLILRGDSNFPRDSSRPEKLPPNEWQEFQQNANFEEHVVAYFLLLNSN